MVRSRRKNALLPSVSSDSRGRPRRKHTEHERLSTRECVMSCSNRIMDQSSKRVNELVSDTSRARKLLYRRMLTFLVNNFPPLEKVCTFHYIHVILRLPLASRRIGVSFSKAMMPRCRKFRNLCSHGYSLSERALAEISCT